MAITGKKPSSFKEWLWSAKVFTTIVWILFPVAGDAFSIPTMIVNKGDNVTVHFYNVDPVTDERHSFTIGAPYNLDADITFEESTVVSFMVDHEGIYQYYCKYHLPVMIGQLEVVS